MQIQATLSHIHEVHQIIIKSKTLATLGGSSSLKQPLSTLKDSLKLLSNPCTYPALYLQPFALKTYD